MKILLVAIVLVAGIVLVAALRSCDDYPRADLEVVDDLHRDLLPSSIPTLKDIIGSSTEPYVRERAIFALTDIAIAHTIPEEAAPFLKELALHERQPTVRTAAWGNLELLRESHPILIDGSLALRMDGEVKTGSRVRLVCTALVSSPSVSATVGVERIVSFRTEPTGTVAFAPGTYSSQHAQLPAFEPKEFVFEFDLSGSGSFGVLVVLKLDYDRVDYATLESQGVITFNEKGGSFRVH